jgi:flagellar FliL protein
VPEETGPVKEQEEAKPKKGGLAIGKMLMVVGLAFAASAAGGVVSFILISKTTTLGAPAAGHEDSQQEESEKIAEIFEKGAVLPLEPFVVNLADIEAARYLRIKITLMIDDKEKLPHVVENVALQQKVRDVILQTLSGKTSKDLTNEAGKNQLRQELQEKVSVYFHDPKLLEIMFTEFVIQL